jgi:hypothetical protein
LWFLILATSAFLLLSGLMASKAARAYNIAYDTTNRLANAQPVGGPKAAESKQETPPK